MTASYLLRISTVKVGDVLLPDADFNCMKEGEEKVVKARSDGTLYVDCTKGQHTLDGQIQGDYYVGFTRKVG